MKLLEKITSIVKHVGNTTACIGERVRPARSAARLARHTGRLLVNEAPRVSGGIPRGAEYGARGARAPQSTQVRTTRRNFPSRKISAHLTHPRQ